MIYSQYLWFYIITHAETSCIILYGEGYYALSGDGIIGLSDVKYTCRMIPGSIEEVVFTTSEDWYVATKKFGTRSTFEYIQIPSCGSLLWLGLIYVSYRSALLTEVKVFFAGTYYES